MLPRYFPLKMINYAFHYNILIINEVSYKEAFDTGIT